MPRSLPSARPIEPAGRRATSLPDALDFNIIGALQIDPLTTNKDMAGRFGVAEPTIANRIRSMTERRVIRVTVQRDLASLGFPVSAFLDIYSDGRPPSEIAADLVPIEELSSVATSLGGPEVMVVAFAATHADLQRLIEGPVPSTRGIRRAELHVVLETLKHRPGFGNLSQPIPKATPPNGADEVDERIISLLAEDGRRGNRDIARRLGLSEGAIRQRLKRLVDARAITRGVVCDPFLLGRTSTVYARFWIDPPHIPNLTKALLASPECFFAAKTTGRFNFITVFVSSSLSSVESALTQVTSKVRGILDTEVKVIVGQFKHRYDLINLV